MTARNKSSLLAGTDIERDEFDDGYYEAEENDRDHLNFDEDEEEAYHESEEELADWDDASERNEEDGWFYDDEDHEELAREHYSYDE